MPGSGAQPTLEAGNVPVAPLVLHGIVGGGSHLLTGEPNARLPCPFPYIYVGRNNGLKNESKVILQN